MPEISRFFGIIITMYYNDHSPPHFHVRYNQSKALIEIETLELLAGNLSRRALNLVQEWAHIHHQEIKDNWQKAKLNQSLDKIEPLE